MLCLLERPSQPVNFNVTNEDDTSLVLTWNEPANTQEVDYYLVSISYYLLATTYAIVCYAIIISLLLLLLVHRFTTVMAKLKQQRQLMCSILTVHAFLKISHHPHNTVFM